jgi:hypothetical protein
MYVEIGAVPYDSFFAAVFQSGVAKGVPFRVQGLKVPHQFSGINEPD